MRTCLKRVILVVAVITVLAVSVLGLYVLESRYYSVGKLLYPAYAFLNQAYQEWAYPDAGSRDTVVYCDYYTWHSPQQWERGYSNQPLLGFYHSLDEQVINKHIEWSNNFGIDVLKVEYLPQFDDTITPGILDADLGQTKICLMYDSRLRFESVGFASPPYDFDQEKIATTFIDDMNHIADTYFDSDNYFKIDGRPVLWIYVTRDFTGPYKQVIDTVRENLSDRGLPGIPGRGYSFLELQAGPGKCF